ncbi:3D-(3,5/4)-trihydroxycyclohexane-1,2-dione acylhydrolase (decyclizing) [Marinobacterium rhizophilum]|uniref:3D-(3,5/4)-trihydroxycyclohexane-1,2-dione acylhydrolase (decyclizing) n=1 Tax=Marinobacterium rhizophilum TaxID=420402 RepID=UPI0003620440|nr:3D-(3,5/4)-trihydroxycyclohexane-1,2-dione acylhydrolase (decyclizing) [Marinobacterium rhizophilum]
METVRLTLAEALARYLSAQKIEVQGERVPLFGCSFAIFGHGNVTCLGQQLKNIEDTIPTWRGQNEQSMATAAIAYAKANKRQRIGIASASIGPGATNMLTAAGIAHTNRLPLLMFAGDAHVSRLPDPVLQQTEHFHDPALTVNDAFKAVTRYWDRVVHPAQLLQTLPQAIETMLDPATCGPVFISLPQDVQGLAYDYPEAFFAERVHRIRRPEAEQTELEAAAEILKSARRPLIISGGGVHYSDACDALLQLAEAHNIPVVETIAGRATLLQSHRLNGGPIGVTGSNSANYLAGHADVVLAIGTRLQDFTTGSWSVFRDPNLKIVSLNVARFDATKHFALPLIADARSGMARLNSLLGDYRADDAWAQSAFDEAEKWKALCAQRAEVIPGTDASYAQVIAAVNRLQEPGDTVLAAAGGLPAELNMNWQSRQLGKFDIEFGFSCMGYEIAGGWGAKMANPDSEVVVLVGDGSYMMMNSDIYSSVLSGHKLIVVVCDNGGYAVINKLQNNTGNESFNNLLKDCRRTVPDLARVDFVMHAQAQGARSEKVASLADFDAAYARAKASDRTYVLVLDIDSTKWSSCDCWWDVGLPEVTRNERTAKAVSDFGLGRKYQRQGI